MITLTKKLKGNCREAPSSPSGNKRISIRDQLLVKEVVEMETNLPEGVEVKFENPDVLHKFKISISPMEGYWSSGTFEFNVSIPEEYNITPPIVKCETRLWHPNINEEGEICLSLLRQNSIDGLGWAPTRKLKDLIWGLNSLFTDLLNFNDPLNMEAAELYQRDKDSFSTKVREYISKHCSKR